MSLPEAQKRCETKDNLSPKNSQSAPLCGLASQRVSGDQRVSRDKQSAGTSESPKTQTPPRSKIIANCGRTPTF